MTNDATTIDRVELWPAEIRQDLAGNGWNGCVGSTLLSETDKVRVWHLHVPVGTRFHFHRHVLDYFWTALESGHARYFFEDGHVEDADVTEGETQHFDYGKGEYMVHSIENIGDTDLAYTTVEFLDSANTPLPLPENVRAPIK